MLGHKSVDRILWERGRAEALERIGWACANKDANERGIKSNALLILSTYHDGGWFVEQDAIKAKTLLEASAELGHSQSCYDIAGRLFRAGDKSAALKYIEKGLENITDQSFNCEITGHRQQSLQRQLEGLKLICERPQSVTPFSTYKYRS